MRFPKPRNAARLAALFALALLAAPALVAAAEPAAADPRADLLAHMERTRKLFLDPIAGLSELVGDRAAALMAEALAAAGRDPAAAQPWGHGVIGMVRAAADWWLRAERPMLRSELAAHLTDLAWTGLSGVVTTDVRPTEARTEEDL